jgi:hypothetical protein
VSARLLAATILVLSGCVEADDSPEGTFSAVVTDPAGDGGTADVVSATLDIADGNMLVRVVLTPASFQADSMLLVFNLDTDENPATGYTSANPGHVGFGIDCMIQLGKYAPDIRAARVSRWENGGFVAIANAALTVITNGYEATLPASSCDDDGRALLKVDTFRQLSAQAWSTRQDWAPDPGQPPVEVR